jgi:hypothetical protein
MGGGWNPGGGGWNSRGGWGEVGTQFKPALGNPRHNQLLFLSGKKIH